MGFELVQDLWGLSWSVFVGRKIVLEDISHIGRDFGGGATFKWFVSGIGFRL